MDEYVSTLERLGLPTAFGVLLLTLGVVLVCTKWLSGHDLGPFKVPRLAVTQRRKALYAGLAVLLFAVALHVPAWQRQNTTEAKSCLATITAVLDDHPHTDSAYTFLLSVSGVAAFSRNMRDFLPHGEPHGGPFNNWRTFEVPIEVTPEQLARRRLDIEVELQGGRAEDWLAISGIGVQCGRKTYQASLVGRTGYAGRDKPVGILYIGQSKSWPVDLSQ